MSQANSGFRLPPERLGPRRGQASTDARQFWIAEAPLHGSAVDEPTPSHFLTWQVRPRQRGLGPAEATIQANGQRQPQEEPRPATLHEVLP